MTPAAALATATWLVLAGERHRQDVDIGPAPPPFGEADVELRDRELGTGITLYVNFDGVDLGKCSPSNSKKNCHWYNNDPIAAFSGDTQTKVAILQAMRRHTERYGVRITTLRPDDGDYAMIVYGGTEEEYGALGSAPSGDCNDRRPNEIGFAHLDGELATEVVTGSTTALHEAAHTWGLDHIDLRTEIMFPEGGGVPTAFDDRCHRVVDDVALTTAEPSCPDVNAAVCDDEGQQNSDTILTQLFGPAYVDTIAPEIDLASPDDGQYFQAPADFDVVLDVVDDLHPQAYTMWTWYGDGPRPADSTTTVSPGFRVTALPVGTWEFHVALADEAGNESRLDFAIEVGVDPPPPPHEDGGCRIGAAAPAGAPRSAPMLAILPLLLVRRRRRR